MLQTRLTTIDDEKQEGNFVTGKSVTPQLFKSKCDPRQSIPGRLISHFPSPFIVLMSVDVIRRIFKENQMNQQIRSELGRVSGSEKSNFAY
jgi:hypothetical protein